jgi:hypothetical protein
MKDAKGMNGTAGRDKQEADQEAGVEEMANLSIKVSRRQRIHWLIEAKRQRTSLTAAIIKALTARFGEPE